MGLFDGSNEEDREQQYEYKAVEVDSGKKGVFSIGRGNLTDALNEMAESGWELKGTRETRGKTTHFIFEREYESS